MLRQRKRAPITEPIPFEDPLWHYDKPQYETELEHIIAEKWITDLRHQPMAHVTSDTTVEDTLMMMDELSVSCVLVIDGDKLVGIFSERDVLDRVAEEYALVRGKPVGEVMTRGLVTVNETDTTATALCVMAEGGFRHVPILDLDGKPIGVVSPRRMVASLHIDAALPREDPRDEN